MRWLLAAPVMLLTSCMPAIEVPSIQGTMHSVAYELNRDTKTWTKHECRIKVRDAEQTQSVCFKETISSPPESVLK